MNLFSHSTQITQDRGSTNTTYVHTRACDRAGNLVFPIEDRLPGYVMHKEVRGNFADFACFSIKNGCYRGLWKRLSVVVVEILLFSLNLSYWKANTLKSYFLWRSSGRSLGEALVPGGSQHDVSDVLPHLVAFWSYVDNGTLRKSLGYVVCHEVPIKTS